ncbi:MAG TPA: hypothetical protein VMV74_04920 [Bacteroidales bacterium]|nr:hypothetical protein [Bacteroidales bacterium]
MKLYVILLMTVILSSGVFGQSHYILSEPVLSNDQRAGFYYTTDLGYGFGLGTVDFPNTGHFYGITAVAGYQATRSIKTGIGMGASQYDADLFFPVYGQFRYSIWAKRIVPYFNADCGYLLNFDDFQGLSSFFVNPALGLHMIVKDRLSVNFSTGILHQSGGPHGQSTFVSFRLGLEFKGRVMNKFMIIK